MAADGLLSRVSRRAGRSAHLAYKGLRQRLAREAGTARHTLLVAGMQRSGTNMLMDVLERSPVTDVYHETDARAFDNYRMRPLPVIDSLRRRSPAPRFVIKALCELDQIPALLDGLAPARGVWIVRNVDDVVNSAVRSFRNFPAQIGRIARGVDGEDWRSRGMSAETRERVRSLWHPHMDEPTAAALMWYIRNVLFFERGLDRDERVRLIRYERLVRAPARELEALFAFAELPYSPAIGRSVFPSSVGRRPAPAIETPVRELCNGLAHRFDALTGNGGRP